MQVHTPPPVAHRTCLQALLETPDAQAADTAGLQLAAALAFAVFGFREYKKLSIGACGGCCARVRVCVGAGEKHQRVCME
jgi:hypothetical protein